MSENSNHARIAPIYSPSDALVYLRLPESQVPLVELSFLDLADLVPANARSRLRVDEDGIPTRFYPWLDNVNEPLEVFLDPRFNFGRLTLERSYLRTDVLADRELAGEDPDQICADFKIDRAELAIALRWERARNPDT